MKISTQKAFKVKFMLACSLLIFNLCYSFYSSALAAQVPATVSETKLLGEQRELKRRAIWQAKFSTVQLADDINIGKQINQLVDKSPLANAGLKPNDIITKVNNKSIHINEDWYDITDALVANTSLRIDYLRANKNSTIYVEFPALIQESYQHLTTYYNAIENPRGFQQRIIITRPKVSTPQPAIFIIQGLSCSSIELLSSRKSNYSRLLETIVTKSDMVVMRVEKPGLGDSEGNCSTTDFSTELAGYEVALKALKALPYVDADKILIYGNSMGSAIAPYLANKYQANAVIADGTFFRSWFEHMLEIERRIKSMQGLSETEISLQMNLTYIPLYYGMLVEKKSYQQLLDENPALAKYNYHGANHMYGRPMSYYHQLQDFDFAGEWQNLSVPVKIRWGTNDWIMSEADNDMIVKLLAAKKNSHVELFKYPGLDHWSTVHASAKDSFTGKSGVWDDNIGLQIVNWAKAINSP